MNTSEKMSRKWLEAWDLEHRGEVRTRDGGMLITKQAHVVKSGKKMRPISGHSEGQ